MNLIRNPETERYDLTHCIFIKIVIPGKEVAAAVVWFALFHEFLEYIA